MSVDSFSTTVPDEADRPRTLSERAARRVRPMVEAIMSGSARQGGLSVVDQAIVSVTSFVTSVIVARVTSRADLGIYYLGLTLVFLARGIQAQVIVAPYLVYSHRRHGRDAEAYTGSVLVHQLVLSALSAVCLVGLAGGLWLGVGPKALIPVVWVLLAAMPLLLIREFSRSHCLCQLKMAGAVGMDVTNAVLQLGALLLLARWGALSVANAYAVMGGVAAVVSVQWFAMYRNEWRIELSRALADWRRNRSFARWALASHLVGSTSPHIMPWILVAASGERAAGLFGACGTLAGVANMFVIGLSNYVAPKAARAFAYEGKAALCRFLWQAVATFSAVVGGCCLLCLVAGEWLVVRIYGAQFAGGGPILTVGVVSVLAISIRIVVGNGLWAIDQPWATLVPDLCSLAVTVGMAMALVPSLGAMGGALAVLGGTVTGAALMSLKLVKSVRALPAEPVRAEGERR